MSDKTEKKSPSEPGEDIKIDYDNIDVTDVMEQIQRNIDHQKEELQEKQEKEEAEITTAPVVEEVIIPEPEYLPLPVPKWKKIVLKVMKPFSPLIKLLVLPVHQGLVNTDHSLDYTNRRLDHLASKMDHICTDLYKGLERIHMKIDGVNERFDPILRNLGKTMEYTKLLHTLSHNIVVELTKLKIEEENLKVKTRILEKDFEFLGKKEKALEKQIFR